MPGMHQIANVNKITSDALKQRHESSKFDFSLKHVVE